MAISVTGEIILCVGYAVILIANIVGNSFVCAVVVQNKKLYNFTSILIVNMAISDLTLGVSGMIHIVLDIVYFLGKVFVHLWFHERKNPSTSLVLLKSRLHLTQILSSVILLFNVCWLPWFILELGSGFGSSLVLRSGLALLAVAQSSLNPFLYSFQSQNFRQHLRKIAKRRKSNPVVIGMGVTKRTGKLFG